jgi:hypothetical protein
MTATTDQREAIVAALKAFEDRPLADAARDLFATLGYKSDRRVQFRPATAAGFLATFDPDGKLSRERALIDDWLAIEFLFQLTDAEVQAAGGQLSLFESAGVFDGAIMESYVFLAIELRSPQGRTGERASRPYPEWAEHQAAIEGQGMARRRMNPERFLDDPPPGHNPCYLLAPEEREAARALLRERQRILVDQHLSRQQFLSATLA